MHNLAPKIADTPINVTVPCYYYEFCHTMVIVEYDKWDADAWYLCDECYKQVCPEQQW